MSYEQGPVSTICPRNCLPAKAVALIRAHSGVSQHGGDGCQCLRCGREITSLFILANNMLTVTFPWEEFDLWHFLYHSPLSCDVKNAP